MAENRLSSPPGELFRKRLASAKSFAGGHDDSGGGRERGGTPRRF
jgi:hypothetical protein